MAPDEQHVVAVDEPLGERPDLGIQLQRPLDLPRQLVRPRDLAGDLLREQRRPHLGEEQRREVQRDHLRRERLRRGDPDLRSRVRVEHAVGLARDR